MERTEKYLQTIRENIGLKKTFSGYNEVEFEIETQYKIWPDLTGSGYVDVGRRGNSWVAQYVRRTAIDDYTIYVHIFERKPSQKDVITADLLDTIMYYLVILNGKTAFTCWECGKKHHWLDISAPTLQERWERFLEKYCGC